MPYANYHSARMNDPSKYDTFAYSKNKFGEGIDAVFGVKDGTSELQAIRFHKKRHSSKQAKKWLKKHGHTPISFEQAKQDEVSKARIELWRKAMLKAKAKYGSEYLLKHTIAIYDTMLKAASYYDEKYGDDVKHVVIK